MKSHYKKILLAFVLIFSFTILSDSYACEDSSSTEVGAHCCMQCCPAHHLVPPVKISSLGVEIPSKQLFVSVDLQDHSLFLVFSIFHPPKLFIS